MSDRTTVARSGDWTIEKSMEDGEISHYVLRVYVDLETERSFPFDEVHAHDGILELTHGGETAAKYDGRDDLPDEIFEELKEIGPY